MRFRKAKEWDLDGVMSIIAETVAEMRSQGSDQWDDEYPTRARFQQDIASATLYVADADGETLGVLAVEDSQPEGYLGLPWTQNTPSLVLHRFAVSTRRRGAGVASFLEQSVCDLARAAGCDHLRVDTYSANAGMQAFLRRRGYAFVGEISANGKVQPYYCYEKLIS